MVEVDAGHMCGLRVGGLGDLLWASRLKPLQLHQIYHPDDATCLSIPDSHLTLGSKTTRQKFLAADILCGLPPRKPLLFG
jgi:hypothetical protein